MIELYEGRLGGGKTYSATVRMVDHLRRGGFVCTNVDLVREKIGAYCERVFGVVVEDDQLLYLAPDQIGLFHRFTPSGTEALPVLVVIDEAHLVFNARDFAQTDKLYRETLTFLTQSRKVATDIIFIAQSVLNMDKQFMRLVQYIWRFRDLARWKIPGLGIQWPLKQILAVQFDYDGRTILQRSFVRKDPAIFALYRTNHIVKPFPRLEVAKTNRTLKKAEKRKPMAKLLIPLGILAGIAGVYWLVSSFGADTAPPASNNAPRVTTSGVAIPSGEDRDKIRKTQYDIYSETFQAWNGPEKEVKTAEGGWYKVGEMSTRGFVAAVSDRRVKVAQPDGRTGWVVALKDPKLPGGTVNMRSASPSPSPSPSPLSSEIIVAPDSRLAPPPQIVPIISPTPFPIMKAR